MCIKFCVTSHVNFVYLTTINRLLDPTRCNSSPHKLVFAIQIITYL
jgi:hypothetical protein